MTPDLAVAALAAVLAVQAGALIALTYKAARSAAVEREQSHSFLLSVLDRVQADNAMEVVAADNARVAFEAERQQQETVAASLSQEVSDEEAAGFYGEAAMARAMMRKAGLDPNDDADVERWDDRWSSNH